MADDDSSTDNSSPTDSPVSQPKKRKNSHSLLKHLGRPRKKRRVLPMQPYKQFAWWIARSENLFINWMTVLESGLNFEAEDFGELDKDSFEIQHARALRIYKDLRRIPGFHDNTRKMTKHPEFVDAFAQELNEAVSGARSNDIRGLLSRGLEYVAADIPGGLLPVIPSTVKKSVSRGFKHPVLARLLCPVKYLNDFDADPERFMAKLEDGSASVTGWDFPAFFYPSNGFDPGDWDSGLLRSPLLLRVFKHIFTSPSSASRDEPGQTKTKGSQAKLNGMNSVNPAAIAYAALQLRWCLSSGEDWRLEDGVFDRVDFYWMIIALFQDDEEGGVDWAEDTLKWWDEKVFGKKSRDRPANENGVPNDFEVAMAQRRSRKAKNKTLEKANLGLSREPLPPHQLFDIMAAPSHWSLSLRKANQPGVLVDAPILGRHPAPIKPVFIPLSAPGLIGLLPISPSLVGLLLIITPSLIALLLITLLLTTLSLINLPDIGIGLLPLFAMCLLYLLIIALPLFRVLLHPIA